MSARTDKKRESIVALTHTEIMLVLAVIILLLLLAKGFALTKSQEQLEESEARIALLERWSKTPGEAAQLADLGKEVTDILIQGGIVNSDITTYPLGENPVAASVSVLVKEKRHNDEMKEKIDKATADADALRRENKALMATLNAIGAADESPDTIPHKKSLKDKIGFLPCWVGSGKRLYYHTYNLTYYSGADVFQITPHRDWRIGADIVDRALSGGLPSLQKYPQGRISRETLMAFGRRLDEEKRELYGSECKLTTTINDETDGKVVKFILDKAKLYPIWRK